MYGTLGLKNNSDRFFKFIKNQQKKQTESLDKLNYTSELLCILIILLCKRKEHTQTINAHWPLRYIKLQITTHEKKYR